MGLAAVRARPGYFDDEATGAPRTDLRPTRPHPVSSRLGRPTTGQPLPRHPHADPPTATAPPSRPCTSFPEPEHLDEPATAHTQRRTDKCPRSGRGRLMLAGEDALRRHRPQATAQLLRPLPRTRGRRAAWLLGRRARPPGSACPAWTQSTSSRRCCRATTRSTASSSTRSSSIGTRSTARSSGPSPASTPPSPHPSRCRRGGD